MKNTTFKEFFRCIAYLGFITVQIAVVMEFSLTDTLHKEPVSIRLT